MVQITVEGGKNEVVSFISAVLDCCTYELGDESNIGGVYKIDVMDVIVPDQIAAAPALQN